MTEALTKDTLYFLAEWTLHPLGAGRGLCRLKRSGYVAELDSQAQAFLALCRGAKTLEGHAEYIEGVGRTTSANAFAALKALESTHFLQPFAPTGSAWVGRPHSRIETVGIVTADRPLLLARCLKEGIEHAAQYGRRVTFLIVDGSRDKENRGATRAIAEQCGQRAAVVYVDEEKRKLILEHLVSLGLVRSSLASFQGGSAGAGRNFLLAVTAGQDLLMIDDDVRWAPWKPYFQSPTIEFADHAEPFETGFFRTREEALNVHPTVNVDLFALHESLLGCPAREMLGNNTSFRKTCAHLLEMLIAREPTIRVTHVGIAGDSGSYCPYNLLFARGPTYRELCRSRIIFEIAFGSREIYRVVKRPTVTHDARCMATCMALTNSQLLPPFSPLGRNQDGVFGVLLTGTDADALAAYLPWGVIHDSNRSSARDHSTILSASETRLSDFLILVLRRELQRLPIGSTDAQYKRLGRHLIELGRLERTDFAALVAELILDDRCRQLAELERLEATSEHPDYWKAAVVEYRSQLLKNLKDPEFGVPVELRGDHPIEHSLNCTQAFCNEFGELLINWPDIWLESSRHDFAGRLAFD